MTRAHVEVVRVMRGRDLHCAGAEFRIDADGVGNDRNLDVRNRESHSLSDEIAVAVIIRMHRDSDIRQHRLGTRRRDRNAAFGIVGKRIPQMIKAAHLFAVLGFLVAERSETPRAPVNHAMSAIYQAPLVKQDEGFPHRARQLGRQRVCGASPVA